MLARFTPPVALVFSGGVSLGSIQVGMLRAVMEAGIQPDLLVGSSAGALNAAFMAHDYSHQQLEQLADIWAHLRRQDVFGRLNVRRLLKVFSGGSSLATADALQKLIASHAPRSYADLSASLAVIATDFHSGKEAVFQSGDLRRHLLASTAIPVVFPPVAIDGRLYADGSVAAHVPLLPAQNLGARTLVVLDVGFTCEMKESPQSLLDNALHAFSLMLHRQATGLLTGLNPDLTVVYLPAPCPIDVPAYDFSFATTLMDAGYETASGFLNTLQISGPGLYGGAHSHAGS